MIETPPFHDEPKRTPRTPSVVPAVAVTNNNYNGSHSAATAAASAARPHASNRNSNRHDVPLEVSSSLSSSDGCCCYSYCCSWWDVLTPEYATGLVFLVIVSVIWAGSSVVLQHMYHPQNNHNNNDNDDNNDTAEPKLNSPFAVTLIGASLFTLWLPVQSGYSWFFGQDDHGAVGSSTRSSSTRNRSRIRYQTLEHNEFTVNSISNVDYDHNHDDDDDDDDNSQYVVVQDTVVVWTHRDHFHAALYIAPVWFIANWTYNASLAYTSVTSSTVLASTGSLFTFVFAVALRDEHFTTTKCVGVVLGVAGSVLTAWHDGGEGDNPDNPDNNTASPFPPILRTLLQSTSTTTTSSSSSSLLLWGDFLGLVSAIGYGTYAVQTRRYCPKDESLYRMPLLLGYIGLLHVVILGPVFLWQLATRHITVPNSTVWGILILKGLLDNVLSDYLWLRAVMLTNATVATVGLGLTIPLAFVSDVLWGTSTSTTDDDNHSENNNNKVMSLGQVGGALVVLLGFVLVNVGNRQDIMEQTAAVHHHHHDHDDDARDGTPDPPPPLEPHPSWRILRTAANATTEVEDASLDDAVSERGQEVVTLRALA